MGEAGFMPASGEKRGACAHNRARGERGKMPESIKIAVFVFVAFVIICLVKIMFG